MHQPTSSQTVHPNIRSYTEKSRTRALKNLQTDLKKVRAQSMRMVLSTFNPHYYGVMIYPTAPKDSGNRVDIVSSRGQTAAMNQPGQTFVFGQSTLSQYYFEAEERI